MDNKLKFCERGYCRTPNVSTLWPPLNPDSLLTVNVSSITFDNSDHCLDEKARPEDHLLAWDYKQFEYAL
jgi:hypothetical protein